MAPEIIKGKGYDLAVDYWSLGICLYQFLYGFLPFGNNVTSPYLVYEEITRREIKFPQTLNDNEAKRLIKQLLNRTPDVRLGGSFKNLKSDPWFQSVKWVQFKHDYFFLSDAILGSNIGEGDSSPLFAEK